MVLRVKSPQSPTPEFDSDIAELAEDVRYNQRSAAERVNSNLKDNCGGNHVRVRGAAKVLCHLMFGILVVAVEQIMRLVT